MEARCAKIKHGSRTHVRPTLRREILSWAEGD